MNILCYCKNEISLFQYISGYTLGRELVLLPQSHSQFHYNDNYAFIYWSLCLPNSQPTGEAHSPPIALSSTLQSSYMYISMNMYVPKELFRGALQFHLHELPGRLADGQGWGGSSSPREVSGFSSLIQHTFKKQSFFPSVFIYLGEKKILLSILQKVDCHR